MDRQTDRRIMRTNANLRKSLMAIMHETDWDDISIGLICNHANIARSTFYTHFENKQELLDFCFDELQQEFELHPTERGVAKNQTLGFLPQLIAHVAEHGELFGKLSSSTNGLIILNKFMSIVCEFTNRELKAADLNETETAYICGGISGLLEHWHKTGYKLPQAEFIKQVDTLVKRSIR